MSTALSLVPCTFDDDLEPRHRALLDSSAVDLGVFLETGGRTVVDETELPDELNLDWVIAQLPGLLFEHHTLDGRVIAQLRPDTPSNPDQKYVQAPGSGSVISVHPRMRDRVGNVTRVAFVEGTKQYLAAISYVPDDLLAVGIQGCANYSADGVPLDDVDRLVAGATDVVIVFDADVRKKASVWDAGDRLAKHVRAVTGGATTVRFADIPAGGSSGLDDWLAGRPADGRATAFAGLLAAAKALIGRRPKQQQSNVGRRIAEGPAVDVAAGVTWDTAFVTVDAKGNVITKKDQLIDCAAVIVEERHVIDDLNPGATPYRGTEFDLEVSWGTGADRVVNRVDAVPAEDLDKPAKWLGRIPGGLRRDWLNHPSVNAKIAQAIRASLRETAEINLSYSRTGMVTLDDGHVGWLDAEGAITATGKRREARAHLSAPFNQVTFTDRSTFTEEQVRAAVKRSLEPLDLLVDPTPWVLLHGEHAFASLGVKTESIGAIEGAPGSGKSTIVRTYSSTLGAYFSSNVAVSGSDTNTAILDAGVGMQCQLVVLEDLLRGALTPDDRKAQIKAVDTVTRRGYDGGGTGRNRRTVNRSGVGSAIANDPADVATPCFFLVAERLPRADEGDSTAQRILPSFVTKETTMKPGATPKMADLAASGAMNLAHAAYLQWVCGLADAAGGYKEWIATVETVRSSTIDELLNEVPELTDKRQAQVLAAPVIGWSYRLAHAVAVGALNKAEANKLEKAGKAMLIKIAVEHGKRTFGLAASPAMRTLTRIRQRVAAGRAVLGKEQQGAVLVGKLLTPTRGDNAGVPCVALMPEAVAAALGDIKAESVGAVLEPVLAERRLVAYGQLRVWSLLVTEETWNGTPTPDEDEPAAAPEKKDRRKDLLRNLERMHAELDALNAEIAGVEPDNSDAGEGAF